MNQSSQASHSVKTNGEKVFPVIGLFIYFTVLIISDLNSLNPFLIFLTLFCYLYGLDVCRCYIYKRKIMMGHFDNSDNSIFDRIVFFLLGMCFVLVSLLYLLGLIKI